MLRGYDNMGMGFWQNGLRDADKPVISSGFNNTISDYFLGVISLTTCL